jgi:Tol biopolymer transport system component
MAGPAGPTQHPWPGELAVVSGGRLVLVSPTGPHYVAGAGWPSEPAWSEDGKWVAFLRGSALWVARSDGSDAHKLTPATVDEFAWLGKSQGEMLAFSTTNANSFSSQIFVASAASTAVRTLGTYPNLIGFSVAPSGDELAVSYRAGKPPVGSEVPTWRGLLQLVPLSGHPARTVYTLAEGGYAMLGPGWWPDGKGLLFWDDAAGSASIAADGLPLESLDLATGKASTLTATLTHPNWVAWSPSGLQVAVVAGGDRVVWDAGKRIVVCDMPAAKCRPVPLPSSNTMSLDPVWTPGGSLVYDVAPAAASASAVVPPGLKVVGDGPFDQATVDEWYSAMRLYDAGQPLRGAGAGAHDPVATPSGLFFVRGSALWYLPAGGARPVRAVGGLEGPGYFGAGNYYGYIGWDQEFAWHA